MNIRSLSFITALLTTLLGLSSFAQETELQSAHQIEQRAPITAADVSPVTTFTTAAVKFRLVSRIAEVIQLVDYMNGHLLPGSLSETERALPRYNRKYHFGGWINEDAPANCLNTRQEVLVRDAVGNRVEFKEGSKCDVARGVWNDPYTGRKFKTSSALQIDHVVPLKHAYVSGAHAWAPSVRCHFANFMANNFHLRTVNGTENMSKGGRSPDSYMPPNKKFQCQYLNEWMKIKAIWDLEFAKEEAKFIASQLEELGCGIQKAQMKVQELREQRESANNPSKVCRDFETVVTRLFGAAH